MRHDGELSGGSPDLLSVQALRVQEAAFVLADELVRYTLAAQMAWLDLWVRPFLQASAEMDARHERQARTARLMRRGVPELQARAGLHLLPN